MDLDTIKAQDAMYRLIEGDDPDLAAVFVAPLVDIDYLTPGVLDAHAGTHEDYPGRYLVSILMVADDADANSGDRLRHIREHPCFLWKKPV